MPPPRPMQPLPSNPLPSSPAALLPAALLPAEATASLRRAFASEVRTRLPRLLAALRAPVDRAGADGTGPGASDLLDADVRVLAEGAALLGDAAAARILQRLQDERRVPGTPGPARAEPLDLCALLLGRWLPGGAADPGAQAPSPATPTRRGHARCHRARTDLAQT